MSPRLPLFFMVLLAACLPQASAADWRGHVYADANGNGIRDAGETGIAGVAVSDGRDLVRSDAGGRYELAAADGLPVFVVKPPGWRLPRRDDGLPGFWQAPSEDPAQVRSADFALIADGSARVREDAGLQVLVFSDPQVKSQADVGYYARDIVAPLLEAGAEQAGRIADLGLTLGDIVDDALALYPAINAVTARLDTPWLHAPGNHDVDATAADDRASLAEFRRVFGPDTYAWEEPEAAFVVLDDIVHLPGPRPAYVGGLREDQFDFLEAWLPTQPKERLLVLAVHVPLFDTAAPGRPETFRSADRERLFALLREFPKLLLLSGHRHTQRHHRHGAADGWHGAGPLHEYNVGAASGAFWSGAPDSDGVPDATMADGTPNGHARLHVAADGGYRLSWHPARLPADDAATTAAMSLHAPKVLRRGAYPAWGVYANVYMAEADTRVEYRVDDGAWRAMTRVEQPDPRLLAENARDDAADALRGYDRSPEAVPSPHLWRGALPTDLGPGAHRIDVRAFDRWQGEQRASTRYRLDEAEAPR